MEDASLATVFESLIATWLKEFLGCPAIFYEAALTEFFANGSVRDGVVVSTIGGTAVEISESVFAATFELPSEGLTDLSEVPKNMVFDARSLFSDSKDQVSISCFKKELKIEYRLLHDILEKTIYVKAGSFDAVTRDRFLLMMAITFDVKINWSTLLFGVLKAMVTSGSRPAKGFAIQHGVVLSNIPGLELGEPRAFPPPRVLNEKTVHRFFHINEQVGMEKTVGSPPMKKNPKKRAVSKKRPVDSDAEVAPIVKKKRTTKSKPAAAIRLPVEEPVSTTSEQPVAEVATGEREPVVEVMTGDADAAIEQVLAQLDLVFKDSDVERGDRNETWFDRALDEELDNANQEIQDSEDGTDFVVYKSRIETKKIDIAQATVPPRMAEPHHPRRAHERARRLRAGRAWRATAGPVQRMVADHVSPPVVPCCAVSRLEIGRAPVVRLGHRTRGDRPRWSRDAAATCASVAPLVGRRSSWGGLLGRDAGWRRWRTRCAAAGRPIAIGNYLLGPYWT
ncbi:hypothetical protein F511_41055 [Dorcoceras hygrometricum]|uniref:Dystroglycan-like n=1 Tax=Dorcoceras hygrometricum TaxID=472368 RepID=A0A2Z7BVN0_9LAMI|nr:hypothetical protein F511_41055 [Dorcoceras hygrometricum]